MRSRQRCERCGKPLAQYNTDSICFLCQGQIQTSWHGLEEEAATDRTFTAAADCFRAVPDPNSRSFFVENYIDSQFYFRILSQRWLEGVKDTRLRLFGSTDPREAGKTEQRVPLLRDPLEAMRQAIFRALEAADALEVSGELSADAVRRWKEAMVRPGFDVDALDKWWRVWRLGEPYGLGPEEVWRHLVTGEDVFVPFVSLRFRWRLAPPHELALLISNSRAYPYWLFELPEDDPSVRRFWRGMTGKKRRRRPQANQGAGHLIRTWACYCLEKRAGLTARESVNVWNDRYEGHDWKWSTARDEQYSRDKRTLERRLGRLLNPRLVEA